MAQSRLSAVGSSYSNVEAQALHTGFCRTDYHLATPAVAALARTEHIYKEQRFSDHAEMTVDYALTL